MYDVIIVGGGPAGLSAALLLGRCCRRVLVCDNGRPRNGVSHALHGFLSRDGTDPAEFLRLARADLAAYDVSLLSTTVTRIEVLVPSNAHAHEHYRVFTEAGGFVSRKILLATGVTDEWPKMQGADRFRGRGIFHCPYCDAWEYRGKALAALSSGGKGLELALALRQWSRKVMLCTHGVPAEEETRVRARKNGIELIEEAVAEILPEEAQPDHLGALRFSSGQQVSCNALFFSTGQSPSSPLAGAIGCDCDEKNQVCTNDWLSTNRTGCYCAGDAGGRRGVDVQLIVQAASEGAIAAVGINRELLEEEIRCREAAD